MFGAIFSWITKANLVLAVQGWVGVFTGLIVATGLSFLGWLAWNQWRVWRYSRWLAKLPPMESLINKQLGSSKGLRKHPAQTPLNMPEYRATISGSS